MNGEFRIDAGPDEQDFELTAFYAAENLLRRMYTGALARLPDHVRIRAAIGCRAGRTFLIVGPRRSGKTTLALSLLLEGWDLSGDDLVLLQDGESTAFPWKFVANDLSVGLLPLLRHLPGTAGSIAARQDWYFAVAPSDFGADWKIAPAAVDAVFYLEPNYGARSEAVEVGKLDMARRLLGQANAPPSGRRGWIGDVARTLDGSRTYVLRLGELRSAIVAMERLLC